MKKKVAQWIGGSLISASVLTIYLLLYHTSLFSSLILNVLNAYYAESYNISLSGELTGSLLGQTIGMNHLLVSLESDEDTLFSAQSVVVTGWESNWDHNEFIINELNVEDYYINSPQLEGIHYPNSSGSSRFSFIVHNLKAGEGSLKIKVADSLHTIAMADLVSEFWNIDGFSGIDIKTLTLRVPSVLSDSLLISGLIGVDDQGLKHVNDLSLILPHSAMRLSGEYGDGLMTAKLKGSRLTPASWTGFKLPDYYADLSVDCDLDVAKASGSIWLSGTGSLQLNDARIPFDLRQYVQDDEHQSLELKLGSDLNNVYITAQKEAEKDLNGTADVFRLKLDPFIPMAFVHIDEPIGRVNFSRTNDGFDIKSVFESFIINSIQLDSLISDLAISPSGEINIHRGRVTQNMSHSIFSGKISQGELDIDARVKLSDFAFMGQLPGMNLLQGQLYGELNLHGSLQHPQLKGELRSRNLGYSDKLRLNGLAKYELQFAEGVPQGKIAFMGKEGILFGDSLSAYKLLANISGDHYEVEDLHLQSTHNLVSFSGRIGEKAIELDKLNVLIDGDQLKLTDSLKVSRTDQGNYHIPNCVLVFNTAGISLEGNYDADAGLDIDLAFELLDLGDITDFLGIRTDFQGITSGSAEISGPLDDPVIHTELFLTDGFTLGYPSDTARVDLILRGNSVYSNRIDASRAGGHLTLMGQLPWGYKMRGDAYKSAPQNFSLNFDNYRLKDARLTTVVGLPVSGRASGSLSFRGTPLRTKMDAQITINNAKFDTLDFTTVYSNFTYEDDLWTFDSLSMVSTWGYGSGTGSMPISLDMVADDRTALADREMGLHFDLVLNQLPFLSSYISEIDMIEGDFIGDFSLTGPLSAPIRSGKIRGHNGYLELSILGNPVTDIHSEITIIDNTLTIDHFSGRMKFSQGSALNIQGVVGRASSLIGDLIGIEGTTEYAGILTAEGEINLSSFFKPRFDIHLKAEEVYYRSTDGLIEAIADADLSLTGQDTLKVEAVIPVKRAVYYSNFTSEESYQQSISQVDSSLFKYSLNTQYPSDLIISNDQMDAEFEGELWLLDYGDGIMRFTGKLSALEGGKFYYLGNELTIVSGEIIFHSVDFNPQITMEANIEIDGERVKLNLTGDLIEPELVINVENTQLTQSDVLTYLTLNQKLVEVSFDTQSALNPVKTYSEMLVEKQLSKIGREITGLDILDVGINLDSDTTTVPRFQVGQRLSKNLKVTYEGALQPTDGKSDYDFGLEYRINKNVSVTSKINQNGEVELNGRLKFTY